MPRASTRRASYIESCRSGAWTRPRPSWRGPSPPTSRAAITCAISAPAGRMPRRGARSRATGPAAGETRTAGSQIGEGDPADAEAVDRGTYLGARQRGQLRLVAVARRSTIDLGRPSGGRVEVHLDDRV